MGSATATTARPCHDPTAIMIAIPVTAQGTARIGGEPGAATAVTAVSAGAALTGMLKRDTRFADVAKTCFCVAHSKQRARSRRSDAGTERGNASRSTGRVSTAANVSETVSPSNNLDPASIS
jgi:hypothetical protein